MTRVLLRTKLFRPTLPDDFVPRPRLWTALDGGLGCKLILVNAPAGFGKSTLVASWLGYLMDSRPANDLRTTWLSIAETDNEPTVFWSYLAAAIEEVFPESCPATQEILASSLAPAPARVADVLAGECQDLPGDLVLVIDDLYLISNADLLDALMRWVESVPTHVHVVLITRTEPRVGTSRLRARGQLCEVRMADLQFSMEEASAFLAGSLDRDFPTDASRVLHDRTEGWASGLRLAALSLRDRADIRAAVHDLEQNSNRYIGDYLTDEVLHTQPLEVQDFLIRTAPLPRLCAGLCAAVLGEVDDGNSQRILEDLERRNVFLVTLDDHHGWYRYHHLFQALLQSRRRGWPGAPNMAEDLRRAADWLALNEFHDDALEIYLTLEDFDCAEALVARALPALQLLENWHGLSRMLDQFPIAEIDSRPGLLLARAWAQRMLFREPDVSARVKAAETLIDKNPGRWSAAQVQTWRGAGDVLRVLADNTNAPSETMALAERALARLPDEFAWMRAMATSRIAYGLLGLRQTDEAIQLLQRAAARASVDGDIVRMRMYYTIGVIQCYTGTTSEFLQAAERALDLALDKGMWGVVPVGYANIGETLYQMNDVESAKRYIERALEWEPADNFLAVFPAIFRGLTIGLDGGDSSYWRRVFDRLRKAATSKKVAYALDMLDGLEAYHHLLQGRPEAAFQWARQEMPDTSKIIAIDQTELKIRLLAEILVTEQAPDGLARTEDMLTQGIAACDAVNLIRSEIMMFILLARVRLAMRRQAEALDALEQAVQLGEPRGFVRCFIDAPEVAGLLKELVLLGRHREAASRLLSVPQSRRASPRLLRSASTDSALIEPLTEREFDILLCLSEQLSNKEIGSKLGISPLTVRNHTGHIYAKLGVSTRRQAVARAKTLGLLDPEVV